MPRRGRSSRPSGTDRRAAPSRCPRPAPPARPPVPPERRVLNTPVQREHSDPRVLAGSGCSEHARQIHLKGQFLGIKAAIPELRKSMKGASIVNVSSIAGIKGYEGMPA
ncbi:hypothetical protein ASF23_16610 [Curtobacterium sp. Leaf261]|nr:hypothetical protein ASF23_16610 [Curtobacterium sp. Leaf261]